MDGSYYKRHADGIKHCRNIWDNLNGLKDNDYVGTTLLNHGMRLIIWMTTLPIFHMDNVTVIIEDEDNQQMVNRRNGSEFERSKRRYRPICWY